MTSEIECEIVQTCKATTYKLSIILVFIILISFSWILGYSFNFPFLRNKDRKDKLQRVGRVLSLNDGREKSFKNDRANPGKCLIFAIFASVVTLLLLWAFGPKF